MTNEVRRPKGQSNGGQFAPSVNPESTVELVEDAAPKYHSYAGFEGETIGDLRRKIMNLPDDEPVVAWIRTRDYYDGDRNLTHEEWKVVAERFEQQAEKDAQMFAPLHDAFHEIVHEVVPNYDDVETSDDGGDNDEDEPSTRGMNRDDFVDLYQPLTNPRSRERDRFEMCAFLDYGEDLDFVKRQNSDYVWSRRINEHGESEIVNGYYEDSECYFVTETPYDDSISYVVSN